MLGPMGYIEHPEPLELAQLIESFRLHLQAARRSEGTLVMYDRVLGRFGGFLGDLVGRPPSLDDLTRDNARRYLIDLQGRPRHEGHPNLPATGRLSPATVAQHARCLRALASWLHDEGHTEEHRLQRLRVPKVPQAEMRPLTAKEVERLLSTLDPAKPNHRRLAAMAAVLLDTGMRTGELVGLTQQSVDFGTGEIRVTGKGEKQRTVVMGRRARHLLHRYLDHRPPGLGRAADRLFVTSSGRPMSTTDVTHIFTRLRRRCGIQRLHAHLLRHTFAVHFLRNGGDVLTLQRLLGHASLATTNRYVTLATGDLVAAHQRHSPLDNL